MKNVVVTDLAKILPQYLNEVCDLLNAWKDSGLPSDFDDEGVHICHNTNSGNIFLSNENCDVAMINEASGELESWYFTPYEGYEGFFDDLLEEYPNMNHDDQEYMRNIAANIDREDDLPKLEEEPEQLTYIVSAKRENEWTDLFESEDLAACKTEFEKYVAEGKYEGIIIDCSNGDKPVNIWFKEE